MRTISYLLCAASLTIGLCLAPQSIAVFAQSQGNGSAVQKNFGHSLEDFEKKKKQKRKNERLQPGREFTPAAISGDLDVIRVDTTLVVNDVLVVDREGHSVEGLNSKDFAVFEDGVEQSISIFSKGSESSAIPRSIVLVIDHSSSQLPYLKNSIDAAKVLVRSLPNTDRMAIVTDDVEMRIDFTTDRELLARKLDELLEETYEGKIGKSKQYSALLATLNEAFRGDELRPIVIFQTDGDELMGLKNDASIPGATTYRFSDIVTAAEDAGVTVYSVIPSMSFMGLSGDVKKERARRDLIDGGRLLYQIRNLRYPVNRKGFTDKFLELWADARARDESAVAEIARATGGWHGNLETPDQAAEVYAKILKGINQRYMIGYYPENQERDGKLRKITVRINNDPGYAIWGKKRYIAPLDRNIVQSPESEP